MRAGFRCALNIGLHLADVLLAPVGSGSMWNGNGVPNPINPSWSSERWAVRGELATVSPFAHKRPALISHRIGKGWWYTAAICDVQAYAALYFYRHAEMCGIRRFPDRPVLCVSVCALCGIRVRSSVYCD